MFPFLLWASYIMAKPFFPIFYGGSPPLASSRCIFQPKGILFFYLKFQAYITMKLLKQKKILRLITLTTLYKQVSTQGKYFPIYSNVKSPDFQQRGYPLSTSSSSLFRPKGIYYFCLNYFIIYSSSTWNKKYSN